MRIPVDHLPEESGHSCSRRPNRLGSTRSGASGFRERLGKTSCACARLVSSPAPNEAFHGTPEKSIWQYLPVAERYESIKMHYSLSRMYSQSLESHHTHALAGDAVSGGVRELGLDVLSLILFAL